MKAVGSLFQGADCEKMHFRFVCDRPYHMYAGMYICRKGLLMQSHSLYVHKEVPDIISSYRSSSFQSDLVYTPGCKVFRNLYIAVLLS
jgi:hypothetical protein